MTTPIRLTAAMNHSLRDAIVAAFHLMDRCHKVYLAAGLETTYLFNYHGIEVPVNPATTSFTIVADDVKKILREREIAYATGDRLSGKPPVMVGPPHFTGTDVDVIWCRNAALIIANDRWEKDPGQFLRYGINVGRVPQEINPWEIDWQKGL